MSAGGPEAGAAPAATQQPIAAGYGSAFKTSRTRPGWSGALIEVVLVAAVVLPALVAPPWLAWAVILPVAAAAGAVLLAGHYVLQPNEALVLVVFGRFGGTLASPGWYWANPFTRLWSRKVSLRVRSFNTSLAKVNDARGNPIEVSAVIVWRVTDAARSVFEVDDLGEFVRVQSETALRVLGASYPCEHPGPVTGGRLPDQPADLAPAPVRHGEAGGGEHLSLRGNPEEVASVLRADIAKRLDRAGLEVIETRLNHVAYSTEIAESMLRRQQAAAVVQARRTITEGAIDMTLEVIEAMSDHGHVSLDDDRKAQLAASLLVVLTSEHQTTSIVNTGSRA